MEIDFQKTLLVFFFSNRYIGFKVMTAKLKINKTLSGRKKQKRRSFCFFTSVNLESNSPDGSTWNKHKGMLGIIRKVS